MATIRTGHKKKDKHARNSKWFDAKQYPRISFNSDAIMKTGSSFEAGGILTIKGISRQHKIDFAPQEHEGTIYLIGSTTVNRKQFGIDGNMFAFLVGDEVSVELKVPATFN